MIIDEHHTRRITVRYIRAISQLLVLFDISYFIALPVWRVLSAGGLQSDNAILLLSNIFFQILYDTGWWAGIFLVILPIIIIIFIHEEKIGLIINPGKQGQWSWVISFFFIGLTISLAFLIPLFLMRVFGV